MDVVASGRTREWAHGGEGRGAGAKARAAIYNQDRKYSPEAENKRCSGRGGDTAAGAGGRGVQWWEAQVGRQRAAE